MNSLAMALQRAWQNNARWLVLLRPLSWLYGAISRRQKLAYTSGKKPRYKAATPILVIGNISVGGSGKTPLIIALLDYLTQRGISVGVVSRGYGGILTAPTLVDSTSDPRQVGDEPCLIAQKTAVPVAIAKRRKEAVLLLLEQYPNLQMIISDDGLQHHALVRDEEWIVVDVRRGFGRGRLLPEGFLREPIDRLEGAVVVYHEPTPCYNQPLSMHLAIAEPLPLTDTDRHLKKSTVYALTAIGHPPRFFDSLTKLGFVVIAKAYPDHHYFVLDELTALADHPIIVTEKDAVKLVALKHEHPHPIFANIWVLPVCMQLSAGVYRLMDKFLLEHCNHDHTSFDSCPPK